MIYLDHAAATPVSNKALSAMLSYFSEQFFNPSAPYLPAKRVREAYERAKDELAHVIGAKGVDLVITGGATESINLAFTVAQGKVLTLATEHAAVLESAKRHPYALVRVDHSGLVDLTDLRTQLTDEVELVSVSLANNELGTIQPLADIANIIRQIRQQRLQRGITTPLYLHSDASQALNLLDINVSRLGVDLLTINAAKCGGPKGVGALYVGHGVKLAPVTVGGGQERGLRSGTENVPGVIGFATAASEAKKHLSSNRKKYQTMVQIIHQELSKIGKSSTQGSTKSPVTESNSAPHTSIVAQVSEKVNSVLLDQPEFTMNQPQIAVKQSQTTIEQSKSTTKQPQDAAQQSQPISEQSQSTQNQLRSTSFPQPIFLGQSKSRLANFCPVCFPGLDAERLIYRLEMRGVLVSTGAACAANKGSKSHVLTAIGLSDAEIAGSIRVSLGSTNTIENVTEAAQIIAAEVRREYQRIGAPIGQQSTAGREEPSQGRKYE